MPDVVCTSLFEVWARSAAFSAMQDTAATSPVFEEAPVLVAKGLHR